MQADLPALQGLTIALPETRELDLFARMLETRGAVTLRCPLVSILDAPDPAPVLEWLRRCIAGEMDDLILLTGEGLRRLLGLAERHGLKDAFVRRLGEMRKITRGPKPARALRDLGLASDLAAATPTTEGVIAALRPLDLSHRRVGVQLYGSEPNRPLMDFLCEAGATPLPVAPYVYASAAEDARVIELIERLAEGAIDVIAFTSGPQVTRLWEVAARSGIEERLTQGLARTRVAAVGPLVAEALRDKGVTVAMMPSESYFMKPLVNEIVATFRTSAPAGRE